MAKQKVRLRIITPRAVKLDTEVDMVIMRCIDGDMGVLPGRKACRATLGYGILRIINNQEEKIAALFGGIAEVQDNQVSLLTYGVEWPEEIDGAHAEADLKHAEQLLRQKPDDAYVQHTNQILLNRSKVRLEIANRSADD